MKMINATDVIAALKLETHPKEGGYFRRTYTAEKTLAGSNQHVASSIFYMLTSEHPIGKLHRNRSDIIHSFHSGNPIEYTLVSPTGELETVVLGNNLLKGEQPQLVVPGGYWKGTRLLDGENDYGLLSEVVVPEFLFEENEIANFEIVKDFPQLKSHLSVFLYHRIET